MGHVKTIIEESEYGDKKTTIVKKIIPSLITDNYQVMLSVAMEAIRLAQATGKKGNFGVTFIVNENNNEVKRAETFYTESITRVDID